MDYQEQIERIEILAKKYKVDKIYFDNTRGEMEGFIEQGTLDSRYEPVNFSLRMKNQMATEFEKRVTNEKIVLLNSQRMIDQILVVNNDLTAVQTSGGHGDAFWSIALSMHGLSTANMEIGILDDPEGIIWGNESPKRW